MRAARSLALVSAGALALAGCSVPFAGEDEPTSRTSSTSSVRPTADLGRAERQLSESEAQSLLPSRPEGFRTTDVGDEARWRSTDPQVCVDLLRLGWQGRNVERQRTAEASADWDQNPDDTQTYQAHSVRIESHEQPVGPALLGRAGDALGQCSAFAFTGNQSGASFDERILAEGLPVRNIGTQTFAVRLTTFAEIDGRTERLYLDNLSFRVGHNLVTVTSANYRDNSSTEQLEALADETLENLKR